VIAHSENRFPHEVVGHAVWLYHRFCLSFRDVEDLLAQRGIMVSYETIPAVASQVWYRIRPEAQAPGRTVHDHPSSTTDSWRAVGQDGDVIDILVQPRRDQRAAERFFRKLLKG
jgi:putative transposase